ncbi:hypothetical protein LAT59_02025 [Candidatus Gracilibacteria bacterium]|nr:hypothetical protein [Candidatus Gracilibacteria bacterium]
MKKIYLFVILSVILFISGSKGVSADTYQISQQRFIITLKNEILNNTKHGEEFIKITNDFFKHYGTNINSLEKLSEFVYTSKVKLGFFEKEIIMSTQPENYDIHYKDNELVVRSMLLYLEIMIDRYIQNISINTDKWVLENFNIIGFNKKTFQLSLKIPPGYTLKNNIESSGVGNLILSNADTSITIRINNEGFGIPASLFQSYNIGLDSNGSFIINGKMYQNTWHIPVIASNIIKIDENNFIWFLNNYKTSLEKKIFEKFLENVKIID